MAFPNDETTAEVIASRLRADGIAVRVDRGLHGSYQVPSRGQITVLVDERVAARAHTILGTRPRVQRPPSALARLAVPFLVAALVLALIAFVLNFVVR